MRITCLFLFLFINSLLPAQELSPVELREDLSQLKEAIHQFNPALDAYNPNFDQKADSLIATVNEGTIAIISAFKKISQLCALSNEGHFSLGNWTDTVHSGFIQNRYAYLPISVSILRDKVYVWSDFSNEQRLNRGDEILSLNGQSAKEILREIYSATPSDGEIQTYQAKTVELGFTWMYYLFISQVEEHKIAVQNAKGERIELSIQALPRKVMVENSEKYSTEKKAVDEDSFYKLDYRDKTAVLTLPSFDYRRIEEYDIKSKKLYKTLFSALKEKEVENLIIDLRGNTGGRNELADDIVPFIQKKEGPFLKKTISWEGKEKTYKFPKKSKLAFTGKIYVLIDGRTYSAGNSLARYLKEYGDAMVIGEESGTRYEGFVAGSKQVITLAHSQIEIGIPRYHIFFPESSKQPTSNRGLMPDLITSYGIDELILEKDLHMEQARILINNNK